MRVVVSVPLDEVLDPTIPDPGVENPFDLIVVFTIYDDRIGVRRVVDDQGRDPAGGGRV